MTLTPWVTRYTGAGLAPIPIKAATKKPSRAAWQVMPPSEQWQGLGDCNVGLLATGQHVIVDCDSPQTIAAFGAWAQGLGRDPQTIPHNSTASGNRHYHLAALAVPPSFNWGRLAIGPGELRARHAYTVAPCSTFEAKEYTWQDGTAPEDILQQTPIAWADLGTLIPMEALVAPRPTETLPVPLLYRPNIPYKTALLLKRLRWADKAEPILYYPSRSEAEAAVIAALILQGWSFDQIRQTFQQTMPGHYAGYRPGPARAKYLNRTYHETLALIVDTPERVQIAETYHAASLAPWPGRSGAQDRTVYLALLAIAWQFGSTTPCAAYRDLQLWGSLGDWTTARRTMGHLIEAGFVRKVHDKQGKTLTNCYELLGLSPRSGPDCLDFGKEGNTHNVSYGVIIVHFANSELWTPHAMGRSAGLVYSHLGNTPQTALGLAGSTGKHRNTVNVALHRLETAGLADRVTGGWLRGHVSIETVERDLDCGRYANLRQARVERERDDFQEARMQYKGNKPQKGSTMERIAIAEGLEVVNDFCHRCREPGLLQFTGRVDNRQCAHMTCSRCQGKETRKAYRTPAGAQQVEQGPDLYSKSSKVTRSK